MAGNQLCGLNYEGYGTYTAEGITKLCEGLKGSAVTAAPPSTTPSRSARGAGPRPCKAVLKRQAGVPLAPKDLRSSFITFLLSDANPDEALKKAVAHAMRHSPAQQGSAAYDKERRRAHVGRGRAGGGRVRRPLRVSGAARTWASPWGARGVRGSACGGGVMGVTGGLGSVGAAHAAHVSRAPLATAWRGA